jgi:hypothetical protein
MTSEGPKKDILEAWNEICRKYDAFWSVGPDYYRWFAEMSDEQMIKLLRLILLARADEINSWIFAYPRMKSEEDIYDYVQTILGLFAKGYLQFRSDGDIGCYQPAGPLPTLAEEREIDHRIRSAKPLIRPAMFSLLNMKDKSGELRRWTR